MSYKQKIVLMLENVLHESFGIPQEDLTDLETTITAPKDSEHGDFSFPCFRLAKRIRKKPHVIAQNLLPALTKQVQKSAALAQVKTVGPYLNFFVDKAALAARLIPAVRDGSFLQARPKRGLRTMIEYSQPNTHKAFHVGHTRNLALGDALVRICEWDGFEVTAVNYIGDEGAHIAKCLWYYQTHFHRDPPETNRGEFLGELYTKATELLDFSTLTKCPIPNVITALVLSIHPHPNNEKLTVVKVSTGGEEFETVCGGSGFQTGDIVAYAKVGARINGRVIEATMKDGVSSTGMICSGKELGLSASADQIHVFSKNTELDLEVAEYYRVHGAWDPGLSVLGTMEMRLNGVAETLRKLEARDPELLQLWQETKKWSMDEFHRIYAWFGARFDHYFFESEVGEAGKNIVMDFYKRGVFVKSEGAIGADLSDQNLPFLLLIKSDGSGLYATKDLALAREKFERFNIDYSIYVVDDSQSLHFKQVFATLEKMGYEKAKHCHHLAYGLVVLPEGKMSSRAGNVILFSELRHRLEEKITNEFLDKYRDNWPDREIDEASRRIAIATIKYGMLNQDNRKTLVFDLDEWTSRTGNTGPYLLYAYARTRSILRELGDIDRACADWALLSHDAEQTVLTTISHFPEWIERARVEYKPQILCTYLYRLAKDFSRMYDHCSVIQAENEALKISRALLVDAVGLTLKQGLGLLGIPTLERM